MVARKRFLAGFEHHECAVGIPAALVSDQLHAKPVAASLRGVVQKDRRSRAVDRKGIDAAIVVKIPRCQPAANNRLVQSHSSDSCKPSSIYISQQSHWLAIYLTTTRFSDVVCRVSICDEHIQPAIVVDV